MAKADVASPSKTPLHRLLEMEEREISRTLLDFGVVYDELDQCFAVQAPRTVTTIFGSIDEFVLQQNNHFESDS